MASQTDIYNMALMRIGVFNGAVEDVSEQSKEAVVCGMFYDLVRQYVLRDYPWNFAETRTTLASLGTPPQNWQYNYALPSDFIRALYITVPGVRRPRYDLQPAYKLISSGVPDVSGVGSGGFSQSPGLTMQLVTDISPCELVYTANVTDLNQWDPMAISALAYRLGAEIAMPMKANPATAQSCMQGYYREASMAAARSMNEEILDPEPDGAILAARGTGRTGMFPDGYPVWPNGMVE